MHHKSCHDVQSIYGWHSPERPWPSFSVWFIVTTAPLRRPHESFVSSSLTRVLQSENISFNSKLNVQSKTLLFIMLSPGDAFQKIGILSFGGSECRTFLLFSGWYNIVLFIFKPNLFHKLNINQFYLFYFWSKIIFRCFVKCGYLTLPTYFSPVFFVYVSLKCFFVLILCSGRDDHPVQKNPLVIWAECLLQTNYGQLND